jgi:transcriptional regulator with GAF, ATPase, and Fis domain
MREDGFDEEQPQDEWGTEESAVAAQLRHAVDAIDISNSLTAPLKRAIDMLLELAAESVGSKEASVLVRDGNEGGLRFLTAISDVKEKLLKLRIPPGKGIAGLVFSTGQPMAVADVSGEGSFWSEADAKTGFKTITLLATPLRVEGEIIGVLEFVNRLGEPPYPPFTPEEMDRAAEFAQAIARIIDTHDLATLIESYFDQSIKASFAPRPAWEDSSSGTQDWLESLDSAPEHRDLMLLWVSLREMIGRGDAERELCRELIESLARFMKKHGGSSSSYTGDLV